MDTTGVHTSPEFSSCNNWEVWKCCWPRFCLNCGCGHFILRKGRNCFHRSVSDREASSAVCLSSLFFHLNKPLPLSHKPIGSPALITGRGRSSLNIKHLYCCPLGIRQRQRISFHQQQMLSRTFFCVGLLKGCHSTQTICKARHRGCRDRDVLQGENDETLSSQCEPACVRMYVYFWQVNTCRPMATWESRLLLTDDYNIGVYQCFVQCSTTRRDVNETDSHRKVKELIGSMPEEHIIIFIVNKIINSIM